MTDARQSGELSVTILVRVGDKTYEVGQRPSRQCGRGDGQTASLVAGCRHRAHRPGRQLTMRPSLVVAILAVIVYCGSSAFWEDLGWWTIVPVAVAFGLAYLANRLYWTDPEGGG